MASKVKTILNRPKYNYSPTQWFYLRMFQVMFHDACQVNVDGTPTDDAILARAWFAWSEWDKDEDGKRQFTSWPECCHWLDVNWDIETASALEKIDSCADFESPDAIKRLKYLSGMAIEEESAFELPEWARIVPVRDQLSILAELVDDGGCPAPLKKPRQPKPDKTLIVPSVMVDQLSIFVSAGAIQ